MATHEQIIDEAVRLVNEGMSVTLPVKGRSMLPFIIDRRHSVILQKPRAPKTGDVVLAWVDGCTYVIHRIISINGDDITLMGDGNLAKTEHCNTSDIKALVNYTVDTSGKEIYLYTRRRRLMALIWSLFRPLRKYLLPVIIKSRVRG